MLTAYMLVPDVPGESVRADHEDEIDVHSIDWNVSQGAAAQVGRGRSMSRAQVGPFNIMKFYDASSPYLALACMQAKSFEEIVISVRKDSGEAHLDYLTITLKHVVISSYDMLPTSENSLVIEERVGLTAEECVIKYTVQADDHSAGDEHEIEYDISAGA
ncbi:MAG: type VI secretion system tube protein Hcp [Pseudomonadota bacterium]